MKRLPYNTALCTEMLSFEQFKNNTLYENGTCMFVCGYAID